MPPIRLSDIEDIANIIKQKYSKCLKNMTFVFCYKKDDGKFLIFQEIRAMPIQRFVYHNSNDSICFSAGWTSSESPYALVVDANLKEVEAWQDLLDRNRLYNTATNKIGAFDAEKWTFGPRENKIEKKKRKKNIFDTMIEFRTDRVERVCFYQWGFEVFSESLSFIALNNRYPFPYHISDLEDIHDDEEEDCDQDEIRWNGKSFDVSHKNVGMNNFSQAVNMSTNPIGNANEPFSYWDRNECDPANDEFDKEIADILLDDREDGKNSDDSFDVGQREVNLLL